MFVGICLSFDNVNRFYIGICYLDLWSNLKLMHRKQLKVIPSSYISSFGLFPTDQKILCSISGSAARLFSTACTGWAFWVCVLCPSLVLSSDEIPVLCWSQVWGCSPIVYVFLYVVKSNFLQFSRSLVEVKPKGYRKKEISSYINYLRFHTGSS